MKTKLLILAIFISIASCTNEDKTRKTLEDAGYTGIEITGYRAFMAGKDDTYSTGFKAISPSGTPVTGAVTGGGFKGYTIRFD